MKTFPVLYKKTATGAIQQWQIAAFDNVIQTIHGQVGGKLQTGTDVVKEGMNAGKANATTPEQQAEAEAKAKWTKQLKKGYVESIEDATAGIVDSVIEGGILPMLAPSKIYPTFAHKLTFPGYVDPKFDGTRMIAVLKNGKCELWSRTRKRMTSLPHIERAIEGWFGPNEDVVLDGVDPSWWTPTLRETSVEKVATCRSRRENGPAARTRASSRLTRSRW